MDEIERTCTKCGETQPMADFLKAVGNGKYSKARKCKKCRNLEHAAKQKARRDAKPPVTAEATTWPTIARSIGVTYETLSRLMTAACSLCGETAPEHRKHNSAYARKDTGAVVGTVCQRCATGLGFFGHDVERLRAALALLTSNTDHRSTS